MGSIHPPNLPPSQFGLGQLPSGWSVREFFRQGIVGLALWGLRHATGHEGCQFLRRLRATAWGVRSSLVRPPSQCLVADQPAPPCGVLLSWPSFLGCLAGGGPRAPDGRLCGGGGGPRRPRGGAAERGAPLRRGAAARVLLRRRVRHPPRHGCPWRALADAYGWRDRRGWCSVAVRGIPKAEPAPSPGGWSGLGKDKFRKRQSKWLL